MSVTLQKGGKLSKRTWNGNKRRYDSHDVTDVAYGHLFDPVEFEDGLTLRDVFLLINRHLDLFDKIFGNWTNEIVTEGLSDPPIKSKGDEDGMTHLELYFSGGDDRKHDNGSLGSFGRAEFHGWGTWDDGTEGGFGVEFTPTYELIDYPIRLKHKFEIYDEWNYPDSKQEFAIDFCLGQVLFGIIWELSFLGPPEDRDEQSSIIRGRIDEAEELHTKITEPSEGKLGLSLSSGAVEDLKNLFGEDAIEQLKSELSEEPDVTP